MQNGMCRIQTAHMNERAHCPITSKPIR